MKTALKERFQDVDDIKKLMTDELNSVPLEVFADCFEKNFLNNSVKVFK